MSGLSIAFDSRAASDLRGVGRYTRSLLAALREEASERGGTIVEAHRPRGADLLHTPWIDGAPRRPRTPTVVTLHDLVPLKRRAEYLRSGLRFRRRYAAVARATRLIVPTRAVAHDAAELLGFDPARIDVVAEAPDPVFHPRTPAEVAAMRARLGLPPEYLLWVGGMRTRDPRKRIAELARVPRELPLVLAGEAGAWTAELGGGVQLTGALDDETLAAVYSGARALIFPSDDEGFGLPPVEALACGTPVAASDVPALREVLAGRATLVAPDDLEGLVEAAEGAARPAPAPPDWSWRDAARATWETYVRATTQPGM